MSKKIKIHGALPVSGLKTCADCGKRIPVGIALNHPKGWRPRRKKIYLCKECFERRMEKER